MDEAMTAGALTLLIEIPYSCDLDDAPPNVFVEKSPNSQGWLPSRELGQMWQDQFAWVYRNLDHGAYNARLHPDAVGQPRMLTILERPIDDMQRHDGMRFVTLATICDQFEARHPLLTD
jgi:hypothetical protein